MEERGFKGLVTNISPHDVPVGAATAQDNLGIFTNGVLSGRKGIVPLPFTAYTPSAGIHELQAVAIDSGAYEGYLTLAGESVNYNASLADFQAALDSGLRGGAVTAAGTWPNFTVTWTDTNPHDLLPYDTSNLFKPATPQVVETQVGDGSNPEIQIVSFVGSPTVIFGLFSLAGSTINYDDSTATLQAALVLQGYDVTVSGAPGGWIVTWNTNGPQTLMATANINLGVAATTSVTRTTAGVNHDIVYTSKFTRPEADYIVYQWASGAVRAIRNGANAFSINTSLNNFQPICALRTRQGFWIAVNGVDRGIRFDGLGTSTIPLGIDAPVSSPSITLASGGASQLGDYYYAYRYVDPDGFASVLTPLVKITTTSTGQEFQWSAIIQPPAGRCTTIELYRSSVDEKTTVYLVTSITANPGGGNATYTDTLDDTTLEAATALPILTTSGALNAYAQVPPPANKPFMAVFQDRVFWYGNVIYTAGTASATNGSEAVTGVDTAWTSTMVGRYFYIAGATKKYKITAVGSATNLTLDSNYAGTTASGLAYAIKPDISEYRLMYFSEQDAPESCAVTNAVPIQENTQDNDNETGLMPFNSFLFLLHERHVYRASFVQQPDIDMSVRLAVTRGCVNNRAWCVAGDAAYLIDQFGAYSFNGQNAEPIGEPIQDLWYSGTLDFSRSQYWSTEYEPNERVVRYYVNYVGDTGNQPKRALCYHTVTQRWWTESYVTGVGHSCRLDISGVNRQIIGSTDDRLLLNSEGLVDGVGSATTGTATGSSFNTLIDSHDPFLSTMKNASLVITSGTGLGQVRRIIAVSGNTLTVDVQWTTIPDTTSTYCIGGIQYAYRTGRHRFSESAGQAVARKGTLVYQSSNQPASVYARLYVNHDTSPKNWQPAPHLADNIVYDDNGPNANLPLASNQYPQGIDPGYKTFNFHGALGGGPLADRYLMAELIGSQAQDRIQFYSLELDGVS